MCSIRSSSGVEQYYTLQIIEVKHDDLPLKECVFSFKGSDIHSFQVKPQECFSHMLTICWKWFHAKIKLHPRKTNIAPEKWWLENEIFLLGRPIFRCCVGFREGIQ